MSRYRVAVDALGSGGGISPQVITYAHGSATEETHGTIEEATRRRHIRAERGLRSVRGRLAASRAREAKLLAAVDGSGPLPYEARHWHDMPKELASRLRWQREATASLEKCVARLEAQAEALREMVAYLGLELTVRPKADKAQP